MRLKGKLLERFLAGSNVSLVLVVKGISGFSIENRFRRCLSGRERRFLLGLGDR